MNRADRMLVVAVVLFAAFLVPAIHAATAFTSPSVVVIDSPTGTTEVPLGVDRTLEVEGHLGDVTVVVRDRAVRVSASSCPDHVCVRSGSISLAGDAIACVPNGVSVRIGGERTDGLDAVAR